MTDQRRDVRTVWRSLAIAVALGLAIFGWVKLHKSCRASDEAAASSARHVAAQRARRENAPRRDSDLARRAALDAPETLPVPTGAAPCALRYEAPPPLGSRRSAFASDPILEGVPRDFASSLRSFLLIGGWHFDVAPSRRGGVGPITERVHMDAWVDRDAEWTRGASFPALVVDEWIDPVLPADIAPTGSTFVPGRVLGRVLVWSFAERRFACAAAVDARNGPLTVVNEIDLEHYRNSRDDPLAKARIDLVLAAMRQGADRLIALR